ncbi:MAG: hypothetical protein WC476_06945 [Phycisphaerae bacterium]|jgi:hypothetical protein
MWLPKDERRLLQGYYVTIGEVSKQHEFPLDDLLGFIKSNVSGHLPPASDWQQYIEEFKTWLKDRDRISIANEALEKRGLITGSHIPQVFVAGCAYDNAESNPRLTFSLTISGYDLGRKYNSWWSYSNLWYAEYIKNHWIWVIVAFLAGIIGPRLVNWVSVLFTKYLGAK